MESPQYGQQVRFEQTGIIANTVTQHSDVEYIQTENHGNVLLMNGEVQLSTMDEHRYHEMLVHPVMKHIGGIARANVLILGGGDGCAAREVFKWPNVGSVTVVDYDTEFVDTYGRIHLRDVNREAFYRRGMTHLDRDAGEFMATDCNVYNAIFIDLPDPDSDEMRNLYNTIIRNVSYRLADFGAVGMHVGPALLNARNPHWDFIRSCSDRLVAGCTGRHAVSQFGTVYVPSFSNEWALLWMTLGSYSREDYTTTMRVARDCRYWHPERALVSPDMEEIYRRRV